MWWGGASPRSAPSRQISPLWFENVDFQPKNRLNSNFWYKFTPLIDFYTIFLGGSESQDYTPIPNWTIVAFKMWP